jgi:hypothetical protein
MPSRDYSMFTPYLPQEVRDVVTTFVAYYNMPRVDYFYRSPKVPTILVGKQRYRLPFYRANFDCVFFERLTLEGVDDPEVIMGDVDVTIDPLFLVMWTMLNMDYKVIYEPSAACVDGCDFDQALTFLEMLEPNRSWDTAVTFIDLYSCLRPIPRPKVRFGPDSTSFVEWIITDANFEQIARLERTAVDGVWSNDTQGFVRDQILNGAKLFARIPLDNNDGDPAYVIKCLKEVYGYDSDRTVPEIAFSF